MQRRRLADELVSKKELFINLNKHLRLIRDSLATRRF
jgi:hypothetical protein